MYSMEKYIEYRRKSFNDETLYKSEKELEDSIIDVEKKLNISYTNIDIGICCNMQQDEYSKELDYFNDEKQKVPIDLF